MTTTRTFLAAHARQLSLHLPTGHVRVTVDPAATAITVLLSTPDDHGPAADAIRRATSRETLLLSIDVPETGLAHQSFGAVVGTVTGMTIVNGRIIGGNVVTADRRATGAITATVTLPPTALGVALRTVSADLTAAGHLPVLAIRSTSGDVRVQSVNVLQVVTVSGDVIAEYIGGDIEVRTTSGDVRIGAYEGHTAAIRTVSGDIHLTAGARATGALTARTTSGDLDLHGTRRLDVRTRNISGRTARI